MTAYSRIVFRLNNISYILFTTNPNTITDILCYLDVFGNEAVVQQDDDRDLDWMEDVSGWTPGQVYEYIKQLHRPPE